MAANTETRIVSLREQLREAREKLQKSREYKKAVGEALDEAGNPLRISAEDSAGALFGAGLAAGVSTLMDIATVKKGEERQKGQPRKPSLWSALGKLGVGGVVWSGNVALPYKFPMSGIRAGIRSTSLVTTAFGIAELGQVGLQWWEKKALEREVAAKAQLDAYVQQRATQIAAQEPKKA